MPKEILICTASVLAASRSFADRVRSRSSAYDFKKNGEIANVFDLNDKQSQAFRVRFDVVPDK